MSPRGFVERDMGDVYGAMAMRSIEKPKMLPCFAITPITWYGVPAMRSSRPRGSRSGKKCPAISVPITTTGDPSCVSCGVKGRPRSISYFLIWK